MRGSGAVNCPSDSTSDWLFAEVGGLEDEILELLALVCVLVELSLPGSLEDELFRRVSGAEIVPRATFGLEMALRAD
jgi:hypothetical protein